MRTRRLTANKAGIPYGGVKDILGALPMGGSHVFPAGMSENSIRVTAYQMSVYLKVEHLHDGAVRVTRKEPKKYNKPAPTPTPTEVKFY